MRAVERRDLAGLEARAGAASAVPSTNRRLGTVSATNAFTTTNAAYRVALDDGGTVVALNIGVKLPAANDVVVLDFSRGEWVFQHDE